MNEENSREKALACTVVSFVPWDLYEEKPGLFPGKYKIPKSDTKTPSLIYVYNKSFHYVYLDDTRGSLLARDPSDEVARSIVSDYINSQLGLSEDAHPAIFWLPGWLKTEEVMLANRAECVKHLSAQNKWFSNLIKIADDDWQRYHKHTVISDFQRTIADIMNLNLDQHPWMSATTAMAEEVLTKECIGCFSKIDPRAKVCPVCRVIQGEQKDLVFA